MCYPTVDDFFDEDAEKIILSKEAEEDIIRNIEKFSEESDRESGEAQIAASKIYLTD